MMLEEAVSVIRLLWEVSSSMIPDSAFPQQSNDTDGFFQHLLTDCQRRPFPTDNILIQILAGSNAEKEPTGHHRGYCSYHLRDDDQINTHRETCHSRTEMKFLNRRGNSAKNTPHK